MARKSLAESFTTEELRQMLVEKHRAARQYRLDHFRRTGRIEALTIEEHPAKRPAVLSELITEDDAPPTTRAGRNQKSARRRYIDRILYIVEIIAVLGLLFVLFNGLSLIRTLNQEVAAAIQQPALTATPLITAVVLPSGHTPPNAPGGARPNEEEIPEHLRPMVQSIANMPVPTPAPDQTVRIQISTIKVDAPVVQGDGWEQLKKGVGQHITSANPGQKGNVVLSAHNDIFGEIFRDLDKLKAGDQVKLFTNQRSYIYTITKTQIVEPTRVDLIAQAEDEILTLVSCYPYMIDNKRIVISAQLQDTP